ncbi:MAG TPA: hypothetical protein VNN74_03775 [Candidatus Micrarchaeia archaeon]|nr:hypothetical protein [Candidatus Micrarchaeia archaeon]
MADAEAPRAAAGPVPAGRGAAAIDPRLRGEVVGMIVGLLLQYSAGMVVNLFVTIPPRHPGRGAADFFAGVAQVVPWAIRHGGALAIHASLGLLLVLNALLIVGRALRLHRTGLGWLAGVGALGVVGAGFNGASFLVYDRDQNSLIMALLFAVALLCYILCLTRLASR